MATIEIPPSATFKVIPANRFDFEQEDDSASLQFGFWTGRSSPQNMVLRIMVPEVALGDFIRRSEGDFFREVEKYSSHAPPEALNSVVKDLDNLTSTVHVSNHFSAAVSPLGGVLTFSWIDPTELVPAKLAATHRAQAIAKIALSPSLFAGWFFAFMERFRDVKERVGERWPDWDMSPTDESQE